MASTTVLRLIKKNAFGRYLHNLSTPGISAEMYRFWGEVVIRGEKSLGEQCNYDINNVIDYLYNKGLWPSNPSIPGTPVGYQTLYVVERENEVIGWGHLLNRLQVRFYQYKKQQPGSKVIMPFGHTWRNGPTSLPAEYAQGEE